MIVDAWRNIGEKNCWKHAGFAFGSVGAEQDFEKNMNAPLYEMWELAKQAGNIIDTQTIEEFIDIDKELDICHELTDSEIVENINQKSIKQVENNKFERDDENDL
ncbi:hypothetical protein HZS_3324, partial [Henneguya salminicola]